MFSELLKFEFSRKRKATDDEPTQSNTSLTVLEQKTLYDMYVGTYVVKFEIALKATVNR